MQTQWNRRGRWGIGVGFKEITTLFYVRCNVERKTIPVCCPSLCAATHQETGRNNCPELHPGRKTHTRLSPEDLQHTLMSGHVTEALSSCSLARWLSVSFWRVSHIHWVSEHRTQVSPAPHTFSDSLEVSQVTGYLTSRSWETLQRPCCLLPWKGERKFFRVPRILRTKNITQQGKKHDWGGEISELLLLLQCVRLKIHLWF